MGDFFVLQNFHILAEYIRSKPVILKKIIIVLMLAAIVASCAKEQGAAPDPDMQTAAADPESSLVDGQVIVQLSEEMASLIEEGGLGSTKVSGMASVLDDLGSARLERLYPDAGEWEPRHRKAGLHRWYRVVYDPSGEPVTKAQETLSRIGGVVYAEPVRMMQSTAFNDPRYPNQWNYFNDGSKGWKYTAGADINVVPVWENYTVGSSDVIVAIIDEGVDLQHEDLAANAIPAGPQGSKCFLDDFPGYKIYPGDHATHVAGTVAAVNDNGKGVCGIAGGDSKTPGARILSCQILRDNPSDSRNQYQGDAFNALVWAADHGAVIAQNSWGYDYKTAGEAAKGGIGAFEEAVKYFNIYAGCDEDGNQLPESPMKGGIVIFAAGNGDNNGGPGWPHAWPAEYDGILSVGAMNSLMGRSYYSNYGDWVDICAPGGDTNVGPQILSCYAGNDYGYMQGTSMACPHVSGVAALIVSYFGGPGFTREMLWDRLIDGAKYSSNLKNQKIGPLLDALGSFTYGSTTAPEKVTDFTSSVQSNTVTLRWKATADKDDVKAYAYMMLFSKDKSDLVSIDPKHLPSTVKSVIVLNGPAAVGEEITGAAAGLEFSTDYWCAVVAYDYSQNFAELSPLKQIRTGKNNPPVVETDYKGSFDIKTFETLRVEFRVSDPDGHRFTVKTESGSAADGFVSFDGGAGMILTIVGRNDGPESYTAHIVVTDEYGASTDYAVNYRIMENHPPKVINDIENILMGGAGETLDKDLGKYFYDEDGEPLQYSFAFSTQNVAHCIQNGDSMSVTAMGFGVVEVTVTATDAVGKSCSSTFKVAVRDKNIPVSLYPNPVTTVLNVSTVDNMPASIRVVNKAGATVCETQQNVSPFEPAVIDMSGCDAGVYSVVFKGGPINERYTVVKK